MNSIGRIDQAILVLKDRLRRLNGQSIGAATDTGRRQATGNLDPLVSLRELVRQGQLGAGELRKALVRTLLAESFGDELATSFEFQAISDRVTQMLEHSDAGHQLLDQALRELG